MRPRLRALTVVKCQPNPTFDWNTRLVSLVRMPETTSCTRFNNTLTYQCDTEGRIGWTTSRHVPSGYPHKRNAPILLKLGLVVRQCGSRRRRSNPSLNGIVRSCRGHRALFAERKPTNSTRCLFQRSRHEAQCWAKFYRYMEWKPQ